MKSPISRPLGITLIAIPMLWIGCFGAVVFPIFLFTGATYHSWLLLTSGRIHSRFLDITGASLFTLVWFGGYILYGFIGFGLWKLRRLALKANIVVQWGFLSLVTFGTAVGCFWSPLLSFGIGVWCGIFPALILWYFKRPAVRWAFDANEAFRAGHPLPAPLPITKKPKLWVQIALGMGAAVCVLTIFVFSLFHFVEKTFRSSLVYQEALRKAGTSPCVQKALGAPITVTGSSSGNLSGDASSGTADMSIPIRGPKSEGTLSLSAVKADGTWSFHDLTVFTSDGQIHLEPEASPCN